MKILLIEDDEVLCKTIQMSLTKAGYDTEICHTGTDGFLYACSGAYDCLIIDRMLPEMDGLTLLQALRRRKIQTPAIFSTALDGLNDRINGLDAGADDYIAKPYAIEELLARIRAVTRRLGRIEEECTLTFEDLVFFAGAQRTAVSECICLPLQKRILPPGIFFQKSRQDTEPRSNSGLCLGGLQRSGGWKSRQLHLLPAPEAAHAECSRQNHYGSWSWLPIGKK